MLTVKEGFALYLSKRVLAESSVDVKTRAMKLFMEAAGKDIAVQDVGYAQAEDFRVWLAKNKSLRAANIYLANFKPFFSWLKMRGFIEKDPFAEIKLFETDRRRKEIFEPDEIERIMRVANPRWKAITMLGLCSLRRSETLNLTIDDINWQDGYINIRPKENGSVTWRWRIKNHQAAIVPLPEIFTLPDMVVNLHKVLKDLIAELPNGQPYLCVCPGVYQRIMQMKAEGSINWHWQNCPWQNFTRDWLRLLKNAAVRRKRYHDLRATLPSMMAKNGESLPEIQRFMRHRSVQTAAEYYISVDESNLIKKTSKIAENFYVSNVS